MGYFLRKDKKKKGSQPDDQNMNDIAVGDDGLATNGKLNSKKKNNSKQEVDDGYVKTDIPWSLSVSYSVRYGAGSEFDYDKMYYKMVFTHNLSFSGSIGLGQGWKVSAGIFTQLQAQSAFLRIMQTDIAEFMPTDHFI